MSAFTDVVCDSRRVTPGALFVAIPGAHDDGTKYVGEARRRGAAEVWGTVPGLCDRIVAAPRLAYAEAAAEHFGRPSEKLLLCGVTGTNGKTTTAWLLRDMMAQGGLRPGLLTTVATEWPGHTEPAERTTPDAGTLQRTLAAMESAGCRAAVMEVSSHALCQERVGACRFAVAAFTNLTQDHLDYHGTMEAYFQAKARLFLEHPEAAAVVNADDPYGRRLLEMLRGRDRVFPYSLEGVPAEYTPLGTRAEFILQGRRVAFESALCGRYNLQNMLCAATAAVALGVTPDAVLCALAAATPRWGRLEPAAPGIFVDYAHTDDALANVLSTLRSFVCGRLICVFGCGGDRDRTKRPKMAAAVERFADVAVITSDNPRTEEPMAIIRDILPGFTRLRPLVEPDRATAIRLAVGMKGPEDVILIAGKGHERYQEISGLRHSFSDTDAVRAVLGLRP